MIIEISVENRNLKSQNIMLKLSAIKIFYILRYFTDQFFIFVSKFVLMFGGPPYKNSKMNVQLLSLHVNSQYSHVIQMKI